VTVVAHLKGFDGHTVGPPDVMSAVSIMIDAISIRRRVRYTLMRKVSAIVLEIHYPAEPFPYERIVEAFDMNVAPRTCEMQSALWHGQRIRLSVRLACESAETMR
jgi:hypothetical protein